MKTYQHFTTLKMNVQYQLLSELLMGNVNTREGKDDGCFWLSCSIQCYLFKQNNISLLIISPMSIVIRSDEVNVLVYKYLQESNLLHTAFTFYNEALLADPLTRFKYDIKSGHLLSLLEKALIFNQIQSHTTISQYEECKQQISLLKPHICSIVEKVKKDNEKMLEEFNQQIYTTMRRTSSIHHTLMTNKEDEEEPEEQRSENYLDRVSIKFHDVENGEQTIKGNQAFTIIYDHNKYTMAILKKEDDSLTLKNVVPCFMGGKLAPLTTFEIVKNKIFRVYPQNICEVIKLSEGEAYEIVDQFKIPLQDPTLKIFMNDRVPSLLVFLSESSYCIINVNKTEMISSGVGEFKWRLLDQYITCTSQTLTLNTLKGQQPLLKFALYSHNISSLEVSPSRIYFFTESIIDNQVAVYTFDKEEPLYIFNYHSNEHEVINEGSNMSHPNSADNEFLKQTIWISGNLVDYLVMLTSQNIKVFQIQLNNYSKIIQVSKYDTTIDKIQFLRKQNDEAFVLGVGSENIIVYDVCQGKIERIQRKKSKMNEEEDITMCSINNNRELALKTVQSLYIIRDSDLEDLFK